MAEIVVLQDKTDGAVYDCFPAGKYTEEEIDYFKSVLNGALQSAGIEDPRVEAAVIESDK